ncbi:MAG: class I SAM-dependent methyltransferase [Ignavibacteriaceae bacterium]
MGFYSEKIIPFFYDKSMDKPHIEEARKEILKSVSGDVLEIGFGTGLNLPHYPSTVIKLTIIDKNPGMNKKAQKRIQQSDIEIESKVLNGEELPFENESFDSVVSTYTLCSINNINKALEEIHRVLKPDGKFFFQEHGLSDNPKIQMWQNFLNPLQKIWADGCNLNRDFKKLIENTGFRFENYKNFVMEEGPKTHGYMYEGVAVK